MPEKIIAVNKDENGTIMAVKTDAGQVYRIDQAVQQAKMGNIAGVQVISRDGREYLRSYQDGDSQNNLDNLPVF